MGIYIKSIVAISAHDTFECNHLPLTLESYTKWMKCRTPEFKKYIPPKVLRRMNRFNRINLVCAKKSLENLGIERPDAIITATSMGCVDDSERFLNQILDNDEMLLTPTSFIQSTHNAVGSNLALAYDCKGYNVVYTHDDSAFETVLLDAGVRLKSEGVNNILIGAADELTEENYGLKKTVNQWKTEQEDNLSIKNSKTKGTIPGEGATFMMVSESPENAELELIGVEVFYALPPEISLEDKVLSFLVSNGVSKDDIDSVVLGLNGDCENDLSYKGFITGFCNDKNVLYYKHICGNYHSDGAFSLWFVSKIASGEELPQYAVIHRADKEVGRERGVLRNVLLVKHANNRNFSFVLVKGV
ncbi:beta-ketoacyl synthase N-terminal-like domain-containing protein [Plebeiibacterium marinum]|uniref:Beta-ketoacyl synthase chain length factor n=1 Tax=Plebeiibacterium marinum TaxID=2992111 RepID=A0AAE3MDV2_9BACT|nr:beta-ketoacyl synthase N-terminal-like domain-containing protein [Plebeiobacterium marinum]MCW3805791.1 beta-ketoacyl synthase chain length factor [Plebeiobacterium marinum]